MGQTLGEVLALAVADLMAAWVDTPELDAKSLFSNVLNLSRAELTLYKKRELTENEVAALRKVIDLRIKRMPVARIVGKRGFYKGEFLLGPDTLEPRPDSETLVEAVVSDWRSADKALRVLDLGTGTGCLLISVLTDLPLATGVGVDVADGAVITVRKNAENNGIDTRARFMKASWTDKDTMRGLGKFDVVISNPPYIPDTDINSLAPEVKNYDPYLALAGGKDGLLAYRQIAEVLPDLLEDDGTFYVEIGQGQENDVTNIFAGAGFITTEEYRDLNGIIRTIKFRCKN